MNALLLPEVKDRWHLAWGKGSGLFGQKAKDLTYRFPDGPRPGVPGVLAAFFKNRLGIGEAREAHPPDSRRGRRDRYSKNGRDAAALHSSGPLRHVSSETDLTLSWVERSDVPHL